MTKNTLAYKRQVEAVPPKTRPPRTTFLSKPESQKCLSIPNLRALALKENLCHLRRSCFAGQSGLASYNTFGQ